METAGSDYLYSDVLPFLSLAFDVQTTPSNAAKYLDDHSLDEGLFGNGHYQRCIYYGIGVLLVARTGLGRH